MSYLKLQLLSSCLLNFHYILICNNCTKTVQKKKANFMRNPYKIQHFQLWPFFHFNIIILLCNLLISNEYVFIICESEKVIIFN